MTQAIRAKIFGSWLRIHKSLRGGQSRHGDHAGDLRDVGDLGGQRRAFGRAAAVVPQDGVAKRLVVGAQRDERMHLARQADRRHLCVRFGGGLPNFAERLLHGGDPAVRRLLAEAGSRAERRMRHRSAGEQPLPVVDEDRLDRRRADVDAEEAHRRSCAARSARAAPSSVTRVLQPIRLIAARIAAARPAPPEAITT